MPPAENIILQRVRRWPLGLLGLLVLSGSACGSPSGPEREISAENMYNRHCSRCHGIDGRGDPSVANSGTLANPVRMRQLSDGELRHAISSGRPPAMPAFGGQFLEPSMKVLVKYVRDLSRGGGPKPSPVKKAPEGGR